jgi:hypothetical protein
MIYLQDTSSNIYTVNGHAVIRSDVDYYSYHIPFTASNYANSLGLKLQEITVSGYLQSKTDIPFTNINKISFDNFSTYQNVFAVLSVDFQTVMSGFYIPFTASLLVSPLRYGTTRSATNLWGLTSTSLTNYGNYKTYPNITYYAPRFYFPLTLNLIDFAGSSITFANSNSKTYGGVSYTPNTPIFDEGLVITANDIATLNISNYSTGTLLLKIKYKAQNTSSPREILKNSNFELQLDKTNGYVKLIKGANTLQVSYSNSNYEAGNTYLIGIQWNASNTYLAVAKWDSTNKKFDSSTLQTTSGAFTLTFGSTYIGSNGSGNWLGDAISDFILYDYQVSNWTTTSYNFTLNPLNFSGLYISNRTAGPITYQNGILTDESGNDITGLVSGSPLEFKPSTSTTIQLLDSLSAKWNVSINDTYYP